MLFIIDWEQPFLTLLHHFKGQEITEPQFPSLFSIFRLRIENASGSRK